MVSTKLLSIAILSSVALAFAAEKATIYSQEPCTGETAEIEPNNKCTIVPGNMKGKVTGVEVPEDIVCNFYKDDTCDEPILYSVEDPGICKFSEWDTDYQKVANESVSILCFNSNEEEA